MTTHSLLNRPLQTTLEQRSRVYEEIMPMLDDDGFDYEDLWGLSTDEIARACVVLLTYPTYAGIDLPLPCFKDLEQQEMAHIIECVARDYLDRRRGGPALLGNPAATHVSCARNAGHIVCDPNFGHLLQCAL
jgi:hypothetical protein